MANSSKLQKSKANDRVPGLKAGSDSQSRFHQYCASSSAFPPAPPLTTLTAAQRLKRFKAVCKKQQAASVNRVRSTNAPVKKQHLAITLIVRKKGVRKSLASTPGKSPCVRSARRTLRKSVLNKNNSRLLNSEKMTDVENAAGESYSNLNNGNVENFQDLKKVALKKVFADEENIEQSDKAFRMRPTAEPFVEYPNENGSNDSVEIDVVNSKYEITPVDHFSSNGNGENNGLQIYPGNNECDDSNNESDDGNNVQNGNVCEEDEEADKDDENSEDAEIKESSWNSLHLNGSSKNVSAVMEVASKNGDNNSQKVECEMGEETFSRKSLENSGNYDDTDEDSSFDAVLQAPVERDSSNESPAKHDEDARVVEESKGTCDLGSLFVSAEVHTAQVDKSVAGTNSHEESDAEIDVETSNYEIPVIQESHTSSLLSNKVGNEKKTKSQKSNPSVVKQATPKKRASPKKPPKRKSSSPALNKSKSKKSRAKSKESTAQLESILDTDTSSETLISESVESMAPNSVLIIDKPYEKSVVSSDSEKDAGAFFKPLSMVRRSQKRIEPVASCSTGVETPKPSEKALVSSPSDEDVRKPSTIQSTKGSRSKRSFSPSRRQPLRSARRTGSSVAESTPLLKRKADDSTDEESTKRVKDETVPTPRWNLLTSPLKYWSPRLTNKIAYKQPDTSFTPDQFSTLSDQETSTSGESPKKASNSNSWCTIA